MKLTVRDFKSISRVDGFGFAPLTMLAGVNSSGKTSLTQALLLLKQTLDGDNKKPLQLKGDYLNAESLADLIFKKNTKGTIAFALELGPKEIDNIDDFNRYSILEDETLSKIFLQVSFNTNGGVHVKELACTLFFGDAGRESFQIKRHGKVYDVSFSNPVLLGGNLNVSLMRRRFEDCKLEFTNFIPLYLETSEKDESRAYSIPVMKDLHVSMKALFSRMEYLGPNRVEPVLARSYDRLDYDNVGVHGENTRFLLNKKKNDRVDGYDETLTQAVSRWICEEMGMASSFDVTRDVNMRYRTVVINQVGSKVDLIHMGYGLSQVLPIIVQGLLTPVGGTFIIIDPEVHLHPFVQGKLVDFFIEMVRKGRHVVVETHSDHIVTRLRRRIAEGKVSPDDEINLCYVENVNGESLYVSYSIDNQGTFTSGLPSGFLDTQDEDFKAIVKAKIARRG
jgi:predicted ATPase